jgi:hypothetical protein
LLRQQKDCKTNYAKKYNRKTILSKHQKKLKYLKSQ